MKQADRAIERHFASVSIGDQKISKSFRKWPLLQRITNKLELENCKTKLENGTDGLASLFLSSSAWASFTTAPWCSSLAHLNVAIHYYSRLLVRVSFVVPKILWIWWKVRNNSGCVVVFLLRPRLTPWPSVEHVANKSNPNITIHQTHQWIWKRRVWTMRKH